VAIIRNEDLKVFVEVEDLLQKKISNEKEYALWCDYWNIVERLIVEKKKITNVVNKRNKTVYKERHKINNAISYLRNKKNQSAKDRERLETLLEKRNEMNQKKEV
jgi:hypothetical protein